MSQDLIAVAGIVHLVQLRVTDAGGVLSDDHLEVGGIGQVNTFNGQRLVGLGQKDHARGSWHREVLCSS